MFFDTRFTPRFSLKWYTRQFHTYKHTNHVVRSTNYFSNITISLREICPGIKTNILLIENCAHNDTLGTTATCLLMLYLASFYYLAAALFTQSRNQLLKPDRDVSTTSCKRNVCKLRRSLQHRFHNVV